MNGIYDPILVPVSILVAMFASYTALDLANSVTTAWGRSRTAWLLGGSLAMGVGLWSMHFIGMLAFSIPGIPIAYGIPLVLVSVLFAIAASALALYVVSRRVVTVISLVPAALLMGAAIIGMHYIGIASMRMAAEIIWNEWLIAASILIALVASFVGLWLAVRFRRDESRKRILHRSASAVVMGIAIAGMHYTAMFASWFEPTGQTTEISQQHVLATTGLAVAVTAGTILILIIAIVGSVIERELSHRAELANENARLYREAEEAREVAEQARGVAEESADRFAFIAEATSVLASSLDYGVTLNKIARLAVPRLADTCIVDLVQEAQEHLERVAVAAREPQMEEVLHELQRRYPPGPDSAAPSARVLRSRKPLLVHDVTNEWLDGSVEDAGHHALIERLDVHSVIAVPLVAREEVLGALTLTMSRPDRAYTREDLALATEIAQRAALAIDNARLYRAALVANQAKSDFLAVISHELRTPINAILGYVDLLLMGVPAPLPDPAREQLDRTRASAKHLSQLIEEVLAFSRIEAGQMEVDVAPFDLADLTDDVSSMIEPLAREKEIAFRHTTPERPVRIESDPGKVRQILLNLLSNAVKFTDEGLVALETAVEDGTLVLDVRDTGIGIAPDDQERIFNPFWQVEQATTREAGGTGLGLGVTRQLARILGGDVKVESEFGKGSRFTVRIPTTFHSHANEPNVR